MLLCVCAYLLLCGFPFFSFSAFLWVDVHFLFCILFFNCCVSTSIFYLSFIVYFLFFCVYALVSFHFFSVVFFCFRFFHFSSNSALFLNAYICHCFLFYSSSFFLFSFSCVPISKFCFVMYNFSIFFFLFKPAYIYLLFSFLYWCSQLAFCLVWTCLFVFVFLLLSVPVCLFPFDIFHFFSSFLSFSCVSLYVSCPCYFFRVLLLICFPSFLCFLSFSLIVCQRAFLPKVSCLFLANGPRVSLSSPVDPVLSGGQSLETWVG